MGQHGERRKTYSAAVIDGFKRNSTIYVGDYSSEDRYKIEQGEDVVVCLPGARIDKVRNSTCPLARDKWIFRRTTKIANIVVRRTTWIAAGSVTRQRSSYFGVRF